MYEFSFRQKSDQFQGRRVASLRTVTAVTVGADPIIGAEDRRDHENMAESKES